MKPIDIVGGGLAGLALGRALRRRDVPVTIHEAYTYPRHRVCGEFICGLRDNVVTELELAPILHDARLHRSMVWFRHSNHLRDDILPQPARALSRHLLDQRLADAFVAERGTLRERERVYARDVHPGRVWATGRRQNPRSGWLGLKAHVRGVASLADLEFHLGAGAYVGLTAVEDGTVNVCGLFRRRVDVRAPAHEILVRYLDACGLDALGDRIRGRLVPESVSAVASFSFDHRVPRDRVVLGDAYAMIPPFTGHGMAIAFESAALAVQPLVDYSADRLDWPHTERAIRQNLEARFGARLRLASILQRFLIRPSGQACFALLARNRWLPFQSLYRALH